MAGRIFIEAKEIEVAGLPLPAVHLYLVHRDDDGAEYVLRSGPPRSEQFFGGDMRVEVNRPIEDSADDRGNDTPEERRSTGLDFDGLSTDEAWSLMVRYARMIDDAELRYEALGVNSNAFVGALIESAGGVPGRMLPSGVDRDEAVGLGSRDDVLREVAPPPDGTVRGTEAAETILGIQVGETIRALGGGDEVRAGRGADRVSGGGGRDLLSGEAGADVLRGGRGADRLLGGEGEDRLVGGAGADRLDGGAGADALRGAGGADVFVLEAGRDRVLDFEEGTDVIEIAAPEAQGIGDLEIAGFGPGGRHLRLAFEETVLELRGVDADRFGAEDLRFAGDFV